MIYLYGAGGHAKVIADILQLNNVPIAGFFDDDPSKKLWDYPACTFSEVFNTASDYLILSIGNNRIRKTIAKKIKANYYMAVHPTAVISKHAALAEGTVIMGGALINADCIIGKHCIINSNAVVDHDCSLADFVHVSPNATLCGDVQVGESTHIGAGAVIIPGKKIGANTVIGAGSVVISDLPDNITAVGNPARIIKANSF